MHLDTRIDDRGTFVEVTIDDGTVFTVDAEDIALVDGYRWFRLNKNRRPARRVPNDEWTLDGDHLDGEQTALYRHV